MEVVSLYEVVAALDARWKRWRFTSFSSHPSGARLPLCVFSAGRYDHGNDVGAPASMCGNFRAPGRGECGHPHMLLWRQSLPMPPPGLSTGCVFPPEVRKVTAAGPACSVHPGGVLETRLTPRRWLVREWPGMAARAGAAARGSTGEVLGGLCAASG